MVKYDIWCIDRSLCDKLLLPYVEYRVIKYPLSIQDDRQKSKMAATEFSWFDISPSDRGDFPRIIEIALSYLVSYEHSFNIINSIVLTEIKTEGKKFYAKRLLYWCRKYNIDDHDMGQLRHTIKNLILFLFHFWHHLDLNIFNKPAYCISVFFAVT